jgi:NAD-dependent deacetylase
MSDPDDDLYDDLFDLVIGGGLDDGGDVVFVTGAGVSAGSGIPTFRGEEGYWTVGSEVYRPEHMATHATFERMPKEVWRWYLYRRGVCRAAVPNAAHAALVELEETLGDRFHLVTQNVDGLHLRAGNSMARTYQVHGNIDFMRCIDDAGCNTRLLQPLPESVPQPGRDDPLSDDDFGLLRCSECGGPARPHVLWFDEYYDEERYQADSSIAAARAASLIFTIGTSGAAAIPHHIVSIALRRGIALVDINPEETPFSEAAKETQRSLLLRDVATNSLPSIARYIRER